nr:hypothetical protein [Marinobacter sp. G11]
MKWIAFFLLAVNLLVWWLPQWPGNGGADSSSGGALPRVTSLKTSGPVVPLPEPGAETLCVRAGWFDSDAEAKAAGEAVGLDYVVEEQEVELAPLNWVLIPPQPEQAAMDQFRALSARGVESYVVASGEYRNAISLGLFESREAAETVLAEKKRDNLNVVLAKFPRNRIGYALVFDVESDRETETVQAVEAEIGKNFEFVESGTCKGVATPKKNP